MSDPQLVAPDALGGVKIGVSVSDSADLPQLGLAAKHAELAIGEIARAILIAGGNIVYGGRIAPSGFTQTLMHEVRRYGQRRHSLTICVAYPEHRKLTLSDLEAQEDELGTAVRMIYLDAEGRQVDFDEGRTEVGVEVDHPTRMQAYSSLRKFMATSADARVVVGGQLRGFQGAMPGVLEEVITSLNAGQPLYLAGGFGGAAAASVKMLGIDSMSWAPAGYPVGGSDDVVVSALQTLSRKAGEHDGWRANGLTADQASVLAVSHRPGDLASLVALGLARRFEATGP